MVRYKRLLTVYERCDGVVRVKCADGTDTGWISGWRAWHVVILQLGLITPQLMRSLLREEK